MFNKLSESAHQEGGLVLVFWKLSAGLTASGCALPLWGNPRRQLSTSRTPCYVKANYGLRSAAEGMEKNALADQSATFDSVSCSSSSMCGMTVLNRGVTSFIVHC